MGLNFFKDSPRYVTMATAAEIIRELPPFVEPVAVFVKGTVKEIKNTVRELGLARCNGMVSGRARPRITEQQRDIIKFIFSEHHHFDAEQLINGLKAAGFNVSRATVFRTLSKLIDADLLVHRHWAMQAL